MGLSNDLLSQFAKATNDNKTNKNNSSSGYGTVTVVDGKKFVQLDGSDLLTPVSTTADLKDGDRVIVTIKNHTAIVTGNLTSPSARSGDLLELGDKVSKLDADKVSTKTLEAEVARINALVAENATINGKLNANEADISTLKADNATIKDTLTANNADIENLKTSKLDAGIAEITYANIDFSNIKMAAVEELFAKSGIIKDLVVNDQSITGELVGVKIKGDLIEANTVKADSLIIQGEDGLYYKLNVNSLGETTASSDPKYQNGLDGSVIVAESITAGKIKVEDLVSFNATIGGFNITDSSIYSNVKSSIGNTTKGIYMGSDGQFSIGDSKNFLKFYEDTDGTYKFKTSFIESTDNGLVVGDLTGTTLKGNVLIDTDSVDIRIGNKILSSYKGDTICLGRNSADSIIDFCDGTGFIRTDAVDDDEMRSLIIGTNGLINLNAPIGVNISASGSTFVSGSSESWTSSSISLNPRFVSDDGLSPPEDGYTSIHNSYKKITYKSGSSASHIDSYSNIEMHDNDFDSYISISNSVSYEDYYGIANITVSGDYAYSGRSSIRFEADDVSILGKITVNEKRVLLSMKDDKYYGMLTPEGSETGWIRTTTSGIIPHSQDSTKGTCSLGTSSWPFASIYGKKLYTTTVNDSITLATDGGITIPNAKGYYGKNTSGDARSLIYMNSSNNTIVGYGGYVNDEGQTNIYGKIVKVFSKDLNTNFRLDATKPYFEAGDSVNGEWNGAGFISNSGKSIYFSIPLAKPVVGAKAVTVASQSGIKIRQHKLTITKSGDNVTAVSINGAYLYGSSASEGELPSNLHGEISWDGNSIRVTATMANTTNVTNNAPCGISAKLTFTFS